MNITELEIKRVSGVDELSLSSSNWYNIPILIMVGWTAYLWYGKFPGDCEVVVHGLASLFIYIMGLGCLAEASDQINKSVNLRWYFLHNALFTYIKWRFSPNYKNYRKINQLVNAHNRLVNWIESQGNFEGRDKFKKGLRKNREFLIRGYQLDYFARERNRLSSDLNVAHLELYQDRPTKKVVTEYLNGESDPDRLTEIMKELDKEFIA